MPGDETSRLEELDRFDDADEMTDETSIGEESMIIEPGRGSDEAKSTVGRGVPEDRTFDNDIDLSIATLWEGKRMSVRGKVRRNFSKLTTVDFSRCCISMCISNFSVWRLMKGRLTQRRSVKQRGVVRMF